MIAIMAIPFFVFYICFRLSANLILIKKRFKLPIFIPIKIFAAFRNAGWAKQKGLHYIFMSLFVILRDSACVLISCHVLNAFSIAKPFLFFEIN